MDSLGEFLKEARLKANISIDQIVEDTHIVKKFIEAIEQDEFSIFPGEAYLKGFLRTYSEYLGLDSNEVIKKYEKIKIMETPTPIEQLIPKPEFNFRPFIIIGIFILIVVSIGIILSFVFKNISSNSSNIPKKENSKKQNEKKEKEVSQNKENLFTIQEGEKNLEKLKKGDIVEIVQEKHKIVIKEVYPIVILTYGDNKELILIQSYDHKLDINNDGNTDIIVTLNNWDNNFANISFKLNTTQLYISDSSSKEIGDNPEVLFTASNIEMADFTIKIVSDTYLRYKIDDTDEVEKYYYGGNNINLKMKEKAIIWLTNSGAVSLVIKNKNLSLGEEGKVVIKLLSWRKNNDNQYDLVMSNLK